MHQERKHSMKLNQPLAEAIIKLLYLVEKLPKGWQACLIGGYLAEAQYRFNHRFNLACIMVRLLRAAASTLPRPALLIRLAEEGR
jgi:hypothetical protein